MQTQKESRVFLQNLLQNPPSLPFEPGLLPTLFAVTQENSPASMADLSALIEHSPKLAARVLAIANSAAYGLEFKVSTLQRAITILGIREIRMLAVLAGMASVIKEAKLPKTFNIIAMWMHQLKTATIAKVLATELSGPGAACGPGAAPGNRLEIAPDEAYVAGLLHDVGKVFFASSRPDMWAAVEKNRLAKKQPCFEAENAYWGIDHALIGAEVLHCWKLPLQLTEPINWHHAPELAPSHKMEARLLAAANNIAAGEVGLDGSLSPAAVALLPPGVEANVLGQAIAAGLASAKADTLAAFVK